MVKDMDVDKFRTPAEWKMAFFLFALAIPNITSSSGESKGLTILCEPGSFSCVSTPEKCVPQKQMCDGIPHCEDSSDEKDCENLHSKKYWDTLYKKRPTADERGNGTCKYPEFRRESLELSLCICRLEKVHCHNQKITDFKKILPHQVEFLDLSGSEVNFTTLYPISAERFQNLRILILTHMKLEKVPGGFLDKAGNLHKLLINGNLIKEIEPNTFSKNKKIIELNLSFNKIGEIGENAFSGLELLEILDLRNNQISTHNLSVFQGLSNLKILHLNNNRIKVMAPELFQGLSNLEILTLSGNGMRAVLPSALDELAGLTHLNLGNNELTQINGLTFAKLGNLLDLNLNDNFLTHLSPDIFTGVNNLQSISMQKNKFTELPNGRVIFQNLTNLKFIYFDYFWLCDVVPFVRSCEPKEDGISSQEHLLANVVLRISVWIMGILSVLGNIFVLIGRLLVRETNPRHSFYIKNLAVADLMMGTYLLIIAYQDVMFRGKFLQYQNSWRHSGLCQWSGVLATLSSQASVLILTLITRDRFSSVTRPFSGRSENKRMLLAVGIILILWLLAFGMSAFPMTDYFQKSVSANFFTSNAICLPLNFHNPFEAGWEYSFFLFVVLNFSAFSYIVYAYVRMLHVILTSKRATRNTQEQQDFSLALRFGLVVLTDFMCWAPIIITKIVAMCGVEIGQSYYGWTAVFILPINSAVNPILYTLTTKLFKKQIRNLRNDVKRRLGLSVTEGDRTTSAYLLRSRTLETSVSTDVVLGHLGGHEGTKMDILRRKANSPNSLTVSSIT